MADNKITATRPGLDAVKRVDMQTLTVIGRESVGLCQFGNAVNSVFQKAAFHFLCPFCVSIQHGLRGP